MSSNRQWTRRDSVKQRLLIAVTIVAVIAALRERAFANSRGELPVSGRSPR